MPQNLTITFEDGGLEYPTAAQIPDRNRAVRAENAGQLVQRKLGPLLCPAHPGGSMKVRIALSIPPRLTGTVLEACCNIMRRRAAQIVGKMEDPPPRRG
jgi:hypothetical protein